MEEARRRFAMSNPSEPNLALLARRLASGSGLLDGVLGELAVQRFPADA